MAGTADQNTPVDIALSYSDVDINDAETVALFDIGGKFKGSHGAGSAPTGSDFTDGYLHGGGHATVNADGSVTFDPGHAFDYLGAGETADVQFGYRVTDSHGASSTALIDVTVTGENDAPVAFDATATADQNAPATVYLSHYDPDANDIDTVTLFESFGSSSLGGSASSGGHGGGEHDFTDGYLHQGGHATLNADGTVTFDPGHDFDYLAAGETRDVVFDYRVTDLSGATTTASIDITVTGENDAPVIGGLPAGIDVIAGQGTALPTFNVNDIDNSDQMTVTFSAHHGTLAFVPGSIGIISYLGVSGGGDAGDLSISAPVGNNYLQNLFNGSDPGQLGQVVYIGNDGYSGLDDVTITVSDNHGGSVVTHLAVNDTVLAVAPVAVDDHVASVTVLSSVTETFDSGYNATWNPSTGFNIITTPTGFQYTDNGGGSFQNGNNVWGPDITGSEGVGNTNALYSYGNSEPVFQLYRNVATTMPVEMTRQDGGTFSISAANITAFDGTNWGGSFHETVTGYLNNQVVAQQSFDVAYTGDGIYDNVVALTDSGFGSVDRVEFVETAVGNYPYYIVAYQFIDNIQTSITTVGPNEDAPMDINVLANDTDTDPLAVLSVDHFSATSALGAAITLNADGTFHYDPTGSAALQGLHTGDIATDTFTYTVQDQAGHESNIATVSLDVHGIDDKPVAHDIAGATTEDGPVVTLTASVSDDTGDAHTFSNGNSYNGVTAVNNNDGTFTYDPNSTTNLESLAEGETLTDAFSYTVYDQSGNQSSATATVVVTGVNDAPVAGNIVLGLSTLTFDYYNNNVGQTSYNDQNGVYHQLITDDGYQFTDNGGGANQNNGNSYQSGPSITGYYGADYTNALYSYGSPYYYGTGAFSALPIEMTRVDGGTFAIGSANITGYDYNYYYGYNGTLQETVHGYLHGVEVATQSFDVPNTYLGYSHNNEVDLTAPGFSAVDRVEFDITASNNGNYYYGGLYQWIDNISVTGNAQAPTQAPPSLDVDVLAKSSDVDHGAILSVDSFDATSAYGATISLNVDGTLHYDPTHAAAINALLAGQTITDTFTYQVKDEHNALSSPATVSIIEHGVDHAPVLTASAPSDGLVEVGVDGHGHPAAGVSTSTVHLTTSDADTATAAQDVVTYDTAGWSSLGGTLYSRAMIYGTVDLDTSIGQLTYLLDNANPATDALAAGASVTDSLSIGVHDKFGGSASQNVTFSIAGSNDAPVAHDDTFGLKTLTFDNASQYYFGSHLGIADDGFVFTDNGNGYYQYNGINTQEGPLLTAYWGVDNTTAIAAKGYIYDYGNTPVTAQSVEMTKGDGGVFSITSANITGYEWTDYYGQSIGANFHETVHGFRNGVEVATQSFDLLDSYYTHNGIIDLTAPGFAAVDRVDFDLVTTPNYTYYESTTYQWIDNITVRNGINEDTVQHFDTATLLANDTDVDTGDILSVLSVSGASAFGAAVVLNNDGTIGYDPTQAQSLQALAAGQGAADSFTYTVSDGHGGTSTATVNVNVTGVNDAPVAVNDMVSTNEDTQVSIAVLANDTDPDAGDTKTLLSVTSAHHGTAVVSGDHVLYTPVANYNGADSFTYTMQDAAGVTSTATVDVTVNPVTDTYTLSNLVTNGSFENGMTGWTQTAGGVDNVDSNGWQPADGTHSLDMNAFSPGGIHQTLSTVAGVGYTVGFDLSKNPGNQAHATLVVSVDNSSHTSMTYTYNDANTAHDMLWSQQGFTFTATGSTTTLDFTSTYPSGFSFPFNAEGPALDEVVAFSYKAIDNFTTGASGGDVIDLSGLLSSISAPHDATAFSLGFLNFHQSATSTLVQIDSNGGGDDYLNVAVLINEHLTQADTHNYLL